MKRLITVVHTIGRSAVISSEQTWPRGNTYICILVGYPPLCIRQPSLLTLALQAQTPSAQIHLEVKDPSGAAIEAAGRLNGPGKDETFQTDPPVPGLSRI